ncbi:MAG: hypothetical protein Q9195_009117 [Heterodermia aff. obscurata]
MRITCFQTGVRTTVATCRPTLNVLKTFPFYRRIQDFQESRSPTIPDKPPLYIYARLSDCALELASGRPDLVDRFSYEMVRQKATDLVEECLGLAGLGVFLAYRKSKFCVEPTMPLHLFLNRTSLAAFLLTFLHSVVTIWVLYFFTVNFQGVLRSTPDTALATSTWAFVRSFGLGWGATIPAAIFNKPFDQLAPSQMQDPAVVALLSGGRAYQHTTRLLLETLPAPVAGQVSSVIPASLKRTWQIAVVFAGLGFALVSLENQTAAGADTEFGIKDKKAKERAEGSSEPGQFELQERDSAWANGTVHGLC